LNYKYITNVTLKTVNMNKLKKALTWLGTGIEGIMDIFREAPYLILPILGVLWMIFRLIDVVFGFSNDYDTYEVLMMGMMITVLLNTESLRNKK
jgi:hypothetical protein